MWDARSHFYHVYLLLALSTNASSPVHLHVT